MAATNGQRVRELRIAANLSHAVLAAMIADRCGQGVSRQALEQVEEGKKDLSLQKTAALANALGVRVSDITLEVMWRR